ncbi:MAG: DEAD/DEAH box helicase family protein [Planctomycetota bacterium]|nr:DEAD/DEAH box helicase family protein [Planctomycetota bacterium]MDA1213595.1 DEAD/DEAH box helicase family protein [Planctomycetota bacterium]
MHTITHEPERIFFESVIAHAITPEAIDRVHHQYQVEQDGRWRKIDFAIIGDRIKLALELDGFRYHAEGQISQDEFSDQLERQNALILDGWTVLRFSWADVSTRPEHCINIIRRSLVADESLHPILASVGIRPHLVQTEALMALKRCRAECGKRGIVVLPTGLGKTFLAAFDMAEFDGRALFVVHNNEVLNQAAQTFQRVMPNRTVGFFHGLQRDACSDVVCANIYSLHENNLAQYFAKSDFDYVVIDEFHHAAAKSYRTLLAYFLPRFTLGLTATPLRTDQQNVVSILDNNIIYSLDAATAIERGYLAPFKYIAYRDNVDYSGIRHNGFRYDVNDLNRALIIEKRDEAVFQRYVENGMQKAIGFCVSVEHADRMAEYFQSRGVTSSSIHSKMLKNHRKEAIANFRSGKLRVVFVRDIFNEGVDFPDVRTLMFLRPTESRLIFMQQLGRGLRLSPSKNEVIVLDFIGNYRGAEHISGYLSALGGPRKEGAGSLKPIYYYDNGCSVTFTEEAIEAISAIGSRIKSDIDIVKKIFAWAAWRSRLPSFCDILDMNDIKVAEIFAAYGSWQEFVSRLKSLDNSWNFADIDLPADLADLNWDQIGEYLDQDHGLLNNALASIGALAPELLDSLCLITSAHPPGTPKDSNEIIRAIEDISKKSRELFDALRVAVFVMSFEHDLHNIPPQTIADGTQASRNLEAVTHYRDTVRAGAEATACAKWLESLVDRDTAVVNEDKLQFGDLLAGHRCLSATTYLFEEIVTQW